MIIIQHKLVMQSFDQIHFHDHFKNTFSCHSHSEWFNPLSRQFFKMIFSIWPHPPLLPWHWLVVDQSHLRSLRSISSNLMTLEESCFFQKLIQSKNVQDSHVCSFALPSIHPWTLILSQSGAQCSGISSWGWNHMQPPHEAHPFIALAPCSFTTLCLHPLHNGQHSHELYHISIGHKITHDGQLTVTPMPT